MLNFIWAIGTSIAVSLISLIGIVTFLFKEGRVNKALFMLIAFSAGGLIGGAFLHLLPEALEMSEPKGVFLSLILGFVAFFILEKYLHWRHCHEGVCSIHAFSYLNLVGDSIHNFIDGLVIGSSFAVDIKFGIITSLVIIFHEIPQEIGDFGVLVYGGFSKIKALWCNFMTALTCILGTAAGFFISGHLENFTPFLLPFTAGGFIYIASCDLVPEIHKEPVFRKSIVSFLFFLLGILFILLASSFEVHH